MLVLNINTLKKALVPDFLTLLVVRLLHHNDINILKRHINIVPDFW